MKNLLGLNIWSKQIVPVSSDFLSDIKTAIDYADLIRIKLFGDNYHLRGITIGLDNVEIRVISDKGFSSYDVTHEFPIKYLTLTLAEIEEEEKIKQINADIEYKKWLKIREQEEIRHVKEHIIGCESAKEVWKKKYKELTGENYGEE